MPRLGRAVLPAFHHPLLVSPGVYTVLLLLAAPARLGATVDVGLTLPCGLSVSEGLHPPSWRVLFWTIDGASVLGALAAAHGWIHGAWPHGPPTLALAIALPAWVVALLATDGAVLPRGHTPLSPGLRAGAAAASGVALGAGAAAWSGLGATWTGAAILVATILAAVPPLLLRCATWLVLRNHGRRRVVLVGPLDCRARLREHIAAHPEAGLAVVAEVGSGTGILLGVPTWEMDGLEAAVTSTDADEVVLSTGLDDRLLVLETMGRLFGRPLVVRYVPDAETLPLFFPRPADIAGLPAIDLSRGPLSPGAELTKWLEDKVVAVVALLILGLPMLLIAVVIKASSPGPVFFVQERHGRYGKVIRVLKFRTMRAEHCSPDVETGQFKQAAKGDLRVTGFGRFLRNLSFDELPQFLNVLLGDMSVVGPRPHALAHNRRFATDIGELMRRHYVKPGITGLAQISGARGETRTVEDMRRRVAFDLEYLRRWSLWLDVTILLRTLFTGWINRHP